MPPATGWTQWLIWAFGGKIVDKNNKVVIDSPETIKALEYAKEMYATFIPARCRGWTRTTTRPSWTARSASPTTASRSTTRPRTRRTRRSRRWPATSTTPQFPVGPVGVPTEYHLFFNQMVMKYTKYPQAAKEFLRFMMEAGAVRRLAAGRWRLHVAPAQGLRQPTRSGRSDPKHTPYRDAFKNLRPAGYAGKLGYASAGALADFIVTNMVAEAASGSKTPKEAAERAQKRAERYYKV
jgi:multiple sugar transport system substrate-binding protein